MLSTILREELGKRNVTVREAARQIGVAHTTVARILAGVPADIATLQKVCGWIGIPVSNVLNVEDKSTIGLANKIALIIEKEPALAKVFAEAVQEIEAGNMTSSDLADIAGYAAYRLRLSKG